MYIIIALLIFLLLSGCAFGPPLEKSEFGKATRCHWLGQTPINCEFDPNRVTIDIDNLNEAIELLEQHQREEFYRRQL